MIIMLDLQNPKIYNFNIFVKLLKDKNEENSLTFVLNFQYIILSKDTL